MYNGKQRALFLISPPNKTILKKKKKNHSAMFAWTYTDMYEDKDAEDN